MAVELPMLRLNSYEMQYTAEHIVDYYDAPPTDIIFMGTSLALNAFDPQVIETEIAQKTGARVHALNLGIAGGTVDVHYLVLKNIITDAKKPAIIVYGLTDTDIGRLPNDQVTGFRYAERLLRPDDFALYSGHTLPQKLAFATNLLCPFCRDHLLLRNAIEALTNPDYSAYAYMHPGSQHRERAANGFHAAEAGEHYPGDVAPFFYSFRDQRPVLHFDAPERAGIDRFINLAQARNIQVVLVNPPTTAAVLNDWGDPSLLARFQQAAQEIAADHGVPLLDLYEKGPTLVPDDGWWDPQHLNKGGAAIVSRVVADQVLVDLFQNRQNGAPAGGQ
jgi:hypothetical protein